MTIRVQVNQNCSKFHLFHSWNNFFKERTLLACRKMKFVFRLLTSQGDWNFYIQAHQRTIWNLFLKFLFSEGFPTVFVFDLNFINRRLVFCAYLSQVQFAWGILCWPLEFMKHSAIQKMSCFKSFKDHAYTFLKFSCSIIRFNSQTNKQKSYLYRGSEKFIIKKFMP